MFWHGNFYLSKTEIEAESDFKYFYNSIYPALNDINIETLYVEKLPSKLDTCFGVKVEVKPSNFNLNWVTY